ncbi:hypothetical protein MKC69_22285, partial [[Clostridium] innocuum]|nr:hypothetical protein [[Clostridium] innocuum]MCR0209459.1 hypothetical protein [[Clostridium] innocuum]MCR0244615.1 hypothetical protein [[Clostridium] innocuum]MCR0257370.1 hypothetical protein [[Clostridium] innocuum]MCR0427019.1 hypothetical protein [[Clostridium] innocuum]
MHSRLMDSFFWRIPTPTSETGEQGAAYSQYKDGSEKFIDLRELDESDPEVYRSIYYKEVPIESKKLSETMIVTYSPKYKAYQAKIRQGQI